MRTLCCFLFLLVAKMVSAQSLPSTLLWRISGNGLPKSSYLYGTMHLTDERIFDLGDSLYKAIENSEGLAIEINPDDFTPFIIDETKKSILQKQKLKDMMSDREFKKYGKALAQRLGKNEDDITTADVLHEKNKWMEESYRTGKMQTFLDAYLFDVARREGKWTGGVEDMADQENLLDYLVDKSDIEQLVAEDKSTAKSKTDAEGDKMIQMYMNSDLNGIQSMSMLGDSLSHDKMLTQRNKKMAMRMDSLGRVRSMVFAVGAAHLPGSDGLIALLKEKGYTVTPVFASQKWKPSDYKVPEITLPWYDVKDESDYYTASMPGKAGNMALYGIMNMKMYFDVFSSTVYMTTAMNSPYSEKMVDSMMGKMAKFYFEVSDYSKGKPIAVSGVPGREFRLEKEKYSRGYLLYKNGMMYIAIAMSMKQKDTTTEKNMNRFLSSFTIHEAANSGETKYITYTNAAKGYAIDVPAAPKTGADFAGKNEDKTIVRDLNIVIDPKTGNYLVFGTNEAGPGYYIVNDSTLLAGIHEGQKDKLASYTIDTTYFRDGRRVMELGGILKAAPVTMKGHYEVRGNRWYALVAMYDSKKDNPGIEHYFTSFKITDYAPGKWSLATTEDKAFTTWVPVGMHKTDVSDSGSLHKSYKYDCFDTARANDYSVMSESFSKYYWQKNDSAMMAKLAGNQVGDNDTLLSQKTVTNGNAHGIEVVVQQRGSANQKRKRMLLDGNKLYTLLTVQPATEIYSTDNSRFFTDFRFTKETPSDSLFISKAALLIGDLSSRDSAVHATAKTYLSGASFSKADLPLLHKALLAHYADDDSTYNNTKEALQDVILKLDDTSTYRFAKDQYSGASAREKNRWLTILLSYPTTAHFNEIKTLLLQQPPTEKPGYSFVRQLTDTLALTAAIFPDLLPLLTDTAMAPSLMRIASVMLDSTLLSVAALQPYSQTIIALAQKNYTRIKKDPEDYDYTYYSVLDVLAALNTTASNAALQNWTLVKKNTYLQLYATSHLLKNKQTVSAAAWQTLAADNQTRTQLYDTLRTYKKTALFPKEYLTQKYFAESYVYNVASDDDEIPTELTYLTQKVVSFKGRQARFFFYKVSYGEDDNATHELACAGPFSLNSGDVSTKNAEGNIYSQEDFDANNLQAQIDALLTETGEDFDWNDE